MTGFELKFGPIKTRGIGFDYQGSFYGNPDIPYEYDNDYLFLSRYDSDGIGKIGFGTTNFPEQAVCFFSWTNQEFLKVSPLFEDGSLEFVYQEGNYRIEYDCQKFVLKEKNKIRIEIILDDRIKAGIANLFAKAKQLL